MQWIDDDGGRAAAGYKGDTRDCVCRSIAIATGLPYQEVYDGLIDAAKRERPGGRKKRSHPRTGIEKPTTRRYMASLGWVWVPTMAIGSGCKVHLREEELPKGHLVVQVTRHVTAVVYGVIYDTFDPQRDGQRCVYGYYHKPQSGEMVR